MDAYRVPVTSVRTRVTTKRHAGWFLLIQNAKGGEDCFLGGSNVTTTQGFIFPKESFMPLFKAIDELWAICPAGKTTILHVLVTGRSGN